MTTDRPAQTNHRDEDSRAAHERQDDLSAASDLEFSSLGLGVGIGVIAGLLGGLAMLVVVVVHALGVGADPLLPAVAVAVTWLGTDGLTNTAPQMALGVLTHYAVSVGWGVVFGIAISRVRLGSAASSALALGYGVLIWALMTFAILPWLNATLLALVETIPWVWFGAHIAYALPLVAIPLSLRNRNRAQEARDRLVERTQTTRFPHRRPATTAS